MEITPLRLKPTSRIAASTVRQHAERAAFLWTQRRAHASADPPDLGVAADMAARLHANMDALAIAGPAAWTFIDEQYREEPGDGELFVAAAHALARREVLRVEHVIALARCRVRHPCREQDRNQGGDGLLGALAWLTPTVLAPSVQAWSLSSDGYRRYLAATAYLLHGVDPGRRLVVFLNDTDARVRGVAYQICGRLQRAELVEPLRVGIGDADLQARIRAALACAALGDTGPALATLEATIVSGSQHAPAALRALLTGSSLEDRHERLRKLYAAPGTRALAVRGAGMTGDLTLRPWLVQHMSDISLASPAAAAFLELHGPLEESDDVFYGDSDDAAAAFGVELDVIEDRMPIAAAFARLLDGEAAAALLRSPSSSQSAPLPSFRRGDPFADDDLNAGGSPGRELPHDVGEVAWSDLPTRHYRWLGVEV